MDQEQGAKSSSSARTSVFRFHALLYQREAAAQPKLCICWLLSVIAFCAHVRCRQLPPLESFLHAVCRHAPVRATAHRGTHARTHRHSHSHGDTKTRRHGGGEGAERQRRTETQRRTGTDTRTDTETHRQTGTDKPAQIRCSGCSMCIGHDPFALELSAGWCRAQGCLLRAFPE